MAMSTIGKRTYKALVPVLLSGFLQGQTASPTPLVRGVPVSPPDSSAVSSTVFSSAGLHVTPLPDSTMALSTATLSVSQSLHILVGQSIFIPPR